MTAKRAQNANKTVHIITSVTKIRRNATFAAKLQMLLAVS